MLRNRIAVGVGGVAVLLGALDAYVLVSVLLEVVKDLKIPVQHLEQATPLITGYLLGYIAGMPLLGRLSDRYGRRWVILACLAGFAAGSVVTAMSETLIPLVIGRSIQGLAGGALLPVTMALVADLFQEKSRPTALGWIGAAQELGAVVGPLFGAGIAAWIGWRGIFWLNIPLAALAALAVFWLVPRHVKTEQPPKVDVVGGLLLAVSLGLLVVGLYNPEPDRSVLPPWGIPVVGGGVAVLILFVLWEAKARTKLLDPAGVAMRPFLAALIVSLCAGAALLVTLVDVQLVAQTLLGKDAMDATLLLTWFLAALPVGALLGGVLAKFVSSALLSAFGMLVSGVAYFLLAHWLAPFPQLDGVSAPLSVALVVAGIGLGLVIAPLSVIVLRVVPAVQHGIASAAVVVARMMGMLIGVAALTAWGLHRFRSLTADLIMPIPLLGMTEAEWKEKITAYQSALEAALRTEYREIFLATAGICLLGAVFSVLLSGIRHRPSGLE